MSFIDFILANHWALDGRKGRQMLAVAQRHHAGVRLSRPEIERVIAAGVSERTGGGGTATSGTATSGTGDGGAVAMDDEGGRVYRRPSAMEISRPWDGALLHRPQAEKDKGYFTQDGVGVVPVEGVLCRYASMINDSSMPRGTSSEAVVRSIAAADADPGCSGIVLSIDSPGGTVAGIEEMCLAVARAKKPVCAHIAYMACSAAYWLASQASAIVAAETALVGNIGVYTVLEDSSAQAAMDGVKVHVVKAGRYKAIGVDGAPVTEEQLGAVQDEINGVYKSFVSAVARGRKMAEKAVETVADGRAHGGRDAVQLRLADKVGTLEDAVAMVTRR